MCVYIWALYKIYSLHTHWRSFFTWALHILRNATIQNKEPIQKGGKEKSYPKSLGKLHAPCRYQEIPFSYDQSNSYISALLCSPLDTPHSAVSVVGSASCSRSTERNINKLKKFLWKCCLSPVHHAVLSHSPWGSAEPFTTFLTFFMPSITPEVVTLEEKGEALDIRPWTVKSISATAHIHQTTLLTSLYPPWAVPCLISCTTLTQHRWVLEAQPLSLSTSRPFPSIIQLKQQGILAHTSKKRLTGVIKQLNQVLIC